MNSAHFLRNVRWTNSAFLIGTLLTAFIGLPIFVYQYGGQINWWLHGSMFVGMFIASGLSITLGYHRLFSHLSFKASWPVRLLTLIFGATAMENSALEWCSDHRRHHKHTDDEDDDPYSIQRGFFFAHMGWIMTRPIGGESPLTNVNDLKRDPLVRFQHKWWVAIGLIVGFGLPSLIGYLVEGGLGAAAGLMIGGVTRLVAVHHMTFFINSLCHTVGRQPYSDQCSAKDSWLMALFTFGEGYHNFHHEFQHDYRNGVKPWQFDPTKWTIRILEKLGLASKLRRVSDETIAMAEIYQKQRCIAIKLEEHEQNICEKTQKLFTDAQEQLKKAHESWEEATKEYMKAVRQKLESKREQLAELQQKVETTVEELREAMNTWHTAHKGLMLKLG